MPGMPNVAVCARVGMPHVLARMRNLINFGAGDIHPVTI